MARISWNWVLPLKSQLLGIATVDVRFEKSRSPLMVGLQSTTASLAKCYEGSLRRINYPAMKDFVSKRPVNYNLPEEGYLSAAAEAAIEIDKTTGEEEGLPF